MYSEKDSLDFLIRAYFGEEEDPLKMCINRAYRDVNRTMRGIAELPANKALRVKAGQHLEQAISKLQGGAFPVDSQKDFNKWHRDNCTELIGLYHQHGFGSFSFGQAQKWINMSMKYIYVLGEERMPGFAPFFDYCHVPLDNIILKGLNEYKLRGLSSVWSKLDDYDEYFAFQEQIRAKFQMPPLNVELTLWNGTKILPKSEEGADSMEQNETKIETTRRAFWTGLLEKKQIDQFSDREPRKDYFMRATLKKGELQYILNARSTRVELVFDRKSARENRKLYNEFLPHKATIERIFGEGLDWLEFVKEKTSRISSKNIDGGYATDRSQWSEIQDDLSSKMERLYKALEPYL